MKNKIETKQNSFAFIIFALVMQLVTLVCLFVCGIYYFERDVQPDKFGSILDAMWWAILTLTTIGYGDMYPITFGGKLLGTGITIIGFLIGVACWIGIVLGILRYVKFLRRT